VPALTLTRKQAFALAACALAVVLLAAHFFAGSGSGAGSVTVEGAGAPASRAVAPAVAARGSPGLVVDVAGAVRRPGVYRLARGSRIADAIARAGGATRSADTLAVNLAAPLADGEQVLMPSRVGPGSAAAAGPAVGASVHPPPVDLNTATAEQLDALPGIGPVTAQKIVDYRQAHGPFTSLDALDAIPGIGPARIASLRGLVVQR
jgi:competence protein ComEA